MPIVHHRCIRPHLPSNHILAGKTMFIPDMAEGSAAALSAAFRWLGISAEPTPASDQRTLEIGGKFTSGDECYPAKITTGDFLKIAQTPGFDSKKTVFLMATIDGPCRFGQYAPFLKKVLRENGFGDVQVMSPRGQDGYSHFDQCNGSFVRTAWRALVAADILRKLLLKNRPYEVSAGSTDKAFQGSVSDLCQSLEQSCSNAACQMRSVLDSLRRAKERFASVTITTENGRPRVGIVGEIFCRLNNFSNQDLVRRLEAQGAECWMSDIAEWISYANIEEFRNLRHSGKKYSWSMLGAKLRSKVQHWDERTLQSIFEDEFRDYVEPSIEHVVELARPYLPFPGAEGEMVVSVGRSIYLSRYGVDGIVDISPFTCMNGVVSEAIYPKVSRENGGIPIRNFYFDGQQSDLDRDIGIYMELVRSYRDRRAADAQLPPIFATTYNQTSV